MKAIVSVIGKDKKGIIAKVSASLFENGANIEDISQTIMQNEFFTMVMLTEIEDGGIERVNTALQALAKEIGVDIRVQHEDIFNTMHRI